MSAAVWEWGGSAGRWATAVGAATRSDGDCRRAEEPALKSHTAIVAVSGPAVPSFLRGQPYFAFAASTFAWPRDDAAALAHHIALQTSLDDGQRELEQRPVRLLHLERGLARL